MDANVVATQFTASATFVSVFQWAQNSTWFKLVSPSTAKWIKRAISVIAAGITHLSIGYVWNPSFDANGHRQLIFLIPSGAVMVTGAWHWYTQYVMNESWFQVLYGRLNLSGLIQALKDNGVIKP